MNPVAVSSPPIRGPSNRILLMRLMGIGWRYRAGCLGILALQAGLLGTTLGAVQLGGLGIDVIRFHIGAAAAPPLPFARHWPTDWPPLRMVLIIAGLILGLAVVRGLLNYWFALASGRLIHERIVVDLRADVYDKLQRLSFRFFDANASGSLISRVTSDVHAVRTFIDGVLIQCVILLLSLVCYLAFMLRIHAGLTLACLATTPVMWLVTVFFSRLVRPQYDRHRELLDHLVLTLTENLQAVHVVKGFGREPEEIAKFRVANRAVQNQQRDIFWRVSVFSPVLQLLTLVNLIVLLAYGGRLVAVDRLPLGTGLVVFAGLLQQFSSQVANLSNLANSVQQSLSGARRVFEILDTPVEIRSVPDAVRLPRARGEVRFEHVSFEYSPGMSVLNDIDFTVRPGQRIAILGATGAGKTTTMSLIARFYDPTQGRVLIDGVDARQIHLDDLRRQIGIVFQESFLFSNTIASNIAFGHPEASAEQISRAARIAAADEFIDQLPHGYDTLLGEYGLNLSGGQRQRLAIARAILLDPTILLLDDPAASIDPHTEQEILVSLRQAMVGRTTFIVAHRLSTLRHADLVIVLENGRITERGSHEELLSRRGHYRDVALSQGVAVDE